jgi:hypothetical protein
MVRFALPGAGRVAMLVVVVISWALMSFIAYAIMRPTYNAGIVTLRTATRQKRRTRLSRVVATVWMYSIVFVALVTSLVGLALLKRDTGDVFGLHKHVLSWQYILHPKFVALLCLSGLSAAAASVVRFRRAKIVDSRAYENAWRVGFAVFVSIGCLGLSLSVLSENLQIDNVVSSGQLVGKAVAMVVASRASAAGFGPAPAGEIKDFLGDYLEKSGVSETDAIKINTFAKGLPKRFDPSKDGMHNRMKAFGFDSQTIQDAETELRRLRRKST